MISFPVTQADVRATAERGNEDLRQMKKLVIIRHGESEWNRKNLFTGWTDVELSEKGKEEAVEAGKALLKNGFDFDICFTSYLKRAINTQQIILKEMDREWLPVIKAYQLNERHYGALQGLNKADTAAKYGNAQVKIWRRSFDVRPPELAEDSPYNARKSEQYRGIPSGDIPMCESLADTIKRTVPYFEKNIKPLIMENKRVFISAHGNSLRSLIKYFEHISDNDIVNVEIPTGQPIVYEFDDNFEVADRYDLIR
jgi:2,3-bisphosphoglycerate-dependent phosphoglycerate mutase